MPKPVLVFGYGNLSRGDDALGPLLIDYVQERCDTEAIDILTDFQLQIEHALDLEHRELVLFADASVACEAPFELNELEPALEIAYTTHALHPASVMAVFQSIGKGPPPPCFLLAIKGETFELGENLSPNAERHLRHAESFIEELLQNPHPAVWRSKKFKESTVI
ncbi:hydrogenase maturation protease [Candidatus Methylomicrobium oryzae]|jgi:hydrogenase maturation protease|uniref:hydrogenase maturation protease n=1 Tax=Candidatus Methylomicrobium oryzae TaxID=2802053 RepID=UPI00192179B2|nr:hydrogenase maturation protease [Methylomicrobium sp. RS1]MBL1262401.1 hydrogenase maturation protease [Methylomicrobium sp. RS1]